MSPQLRSHVWREWHERKWQLAIGAGWMLCVALYAVFKELAYGQRAPVASFYGGAAFFGLLAAVFLAMRTAVGERSSGTLRFSAALPESLRRIALIRLVGAVLVLALPMIAGALLMSICLGAGWIEQAPRRPGPAIYVPLPERASLSSGGAVGLAVTVMAIVLAQSVELLLILCALGARRRSESHVGFLGAPLALFWLLAQEARIGVSASYQDSMSWLGTGLPQSLLINYGYGDANGPSYGDLDIASRVWMPLALNLFVLALLAWWFARRYGTARRASKRRIAWTAAWRRRPVLQSYVPFRWPGRTAALVWLNLRQSLPLALSGLLVACLMATAQIALLERQRHHAPLPEAVAAQLPGFAWFVAMLWATIVAVGIFAGELRPRLRSFWSSRPVRVSHWFWIKYVVGLAAVLLVLDGVTILVSWNLAATVQGPERMSWSYIACMPILHATLYSLAVLAICWIRQPIPAAVAALVFFFLLMLGLEAVPASASLDPLSVYNALFHEEQQGSLDLRRHYYPHVYGTLAAICLAAAAAARPGVSLNRRALPGSPLQAARPAT